LVQLPSTVPNGIHQPIKSIASSSLVAAMNSRLNRIFAGLGIHGFFV
jgi:hypothetical protein